MRVRRPISRLRPMRLGRGFGLLDPGWPARRSGRRDVVAGMSHPSTARVYRRPLDQPDPQGSASPVNLAVTNLTLCPRLELRLASYHRALAETSFHLKKSEQLYEKNSEILNRIVFPGREMPLGDRPIRAAETVLEKITRVFLSRPAQPVPGNSRPGTGSNPDGGFDVGARSSDRVTQDLLYPLPAGGRSLPHPGPDRLPRPYRSAEPLRQRPRGPRISANPRLRPRTETEVAVERLDRIARTHVLRRLLRIDRRVQDDAAFAGSTEYRQGQPAAPRSGGRASAGPAAVWQETPVGRAGALPSPPPSPTRRVFRADPEPPAPLPAPETLYQAPPPAPQIDMGQLDKELWQRFEKRLRIEHERRGRG